MSLHNLRKPTIPIKNNLSYMSLSQLMDHIEWIEFHSHRLDWTKIQLVAMLEQFNSLDISCSYCGLRYSFREYDSFSQRPNHAACIYCYAIHNTPWGFSRLKLSEEKEFDAILYNYWYKEDIEPLYVYNYHSIIKEGDVNRLNLYARGITKISEDNMIKYITKAEGDIRRDAISSVLGNNLLYHENMEDHNCIDVIYRSNFIIKNADLVDTHDLMENGVHPMIRGVAASFVHDLDLHRSLDPGIRPYVQWYILFHGLSEKPTNMLELFKIYGIEDAAGTEDPPSVNKNFKRIYEKDRHKFWNWLYNWKIEDQDFLKSAVEHNLGTMFDLSISRYLEDPESLLKYLETTNLYEHSRELIISRLIRQNSLDESQITEFAKTEIDHHMDDWEYFGDGSYYHLLYSSIRNRELLKDLLVANENETLANQVFEQKKDEVLVKEVLEIRPDLYRELYRISDLDWIVRFLLKIDDDHIMWLDLYIFVNECNLKDYKFENRGLLEKTLVNATNENKIELIELLIHNT